MTEIVLVVLGLILLFLGRKFVWLFVGAVGFVAGVYVAGLFFPAESEMFQLTVALIVGIIFGVLSIFLKKFIIGATGFVIGGYLAYIILGLIGMEVSYIFWLIAFAGGIIGVLLVAVIFDLAIMFLSSMVGAGILVTVLKLKDWVALSIFVVLIIAGMLFQRRLG